MSNISVTIIDSNNALTLDELCRAVRAENALILQFIEYHIIHPTGSTSENWQFDHINLKRARLARNFYYECEVNFAGIGLLLDMMERIEGLEADIARLQLSVSNQSECE